MALDDETAGPRGEVGKEELNGPREKGVHMGLDIKTPQKDPNSLRKHNIIHMTDIGNVTSKKMASLAAFGQLRLREPCLVGRT